jgi:hypothetical protein
VFVLGGEQVKIIMYTQLTNFEKLKYLTVTIMNENDV